MRSGGLALGKVEELALTAQEARFYAAIDGVRTAEELLRDSQDPAATLRLLYLLTELGHLSFSMDADSSRIERSTPAPPPRARATPPPRVRPADVLRAARGSRHHSPAERAADQTPIGTAPVSRPPAPAEAPRRPALEPAARRRPQIRTSPLLAARSTARPRRREAAPLSFRAATSPP